MNYQGDIAREHLQYYASMLRHNGLRLRPSADFMRRQTMITENMRSILVDWLVDVSVHFEVMDETLHLAVSYINRTLSLIKVEKNKL
jgi:cyclin-A